MSIICQVICFFGGLCVFMFALETISENSIVFMGNKTSNLIRRCARNKFYGVLCGAAISSVCQSGAAANAVAVDFANAKILSCVEACAVIVGTNIGSTIVGQISALTGFGVNVTVFSSVVACIGYAAMTFGSKKIKPYGGFLFGLGLLFVGLYLMDERVGQIKNCVLIRLLFCVKNPLLLFLNGIFSTVIIQSSSAFTAMIIGFSGGGAINFASAVYLILGANVGSCFSVLFISLKKQDEGKTAAIFNLVYNFSGALIAFILTLIFGKWLTGIFEMAFSTTEIQIANFQTIFNVVSAVAVLPVITPMVNLIQKFMRDRLNGGLNDGNARQKSVV